MGLCQLTSILQCGFCSAARFPAVHKEVLESSGCADISCFGADSMLHVRTLFTTEQEGSLYTRLETS